MDGYFSVSHQGVRSHELRQGPRDLTLNIGLFQLHDHSRNSLFNVAHLADKEELVRELANQVSDVGNNSFLQKREAPHDG